MIVGSILMAFGIDAWWDERQERAQEQEYLVALLADIAAVTAEAERTIAQNERLNEAARARIDAARELTLPVDSLIAVTVRSAPATAPLRASVDTYAELLSSGGVTTVQDPRVRQGLARLSFQLDSEWYLATATVDGVNRHLMPLISADTTDSNLPQVIVRVEELGIAWRVVHNTRKRDVLRAADDAREAVLGAIERD